MPNAVIDDNATATDTLDFTVSNPLSVGYSYVPSLTKRATDLPRKANFSKESISIIFPKSEACLYFFKLQMLLMQTIDLIAINAELKSDLDLMGIVEKAKDYFPKENWGEVRCLGQLTLEHDVKVAAGRQTLGALLFDKLIVKIGKIMNEFRLTSLFLGLTPDPIVGTSYFLQEGTYRKLAYLVHDYVNQRLGVVSLFSIDEEASSKVLAHGLGHSKGLRHHEKPADLMHPELLRLPNLQINGFCRACLLDLKGSRERFFG